MNRKMGGCLVASAVLTCFVIARVPAYADLIIEATNSTALAGSTGEFDIDLVDTGGSFTVSGFSIVPIVGSRAPIQLGGVSTNTTTAPYIFGTFQSGPAPFSSGPFPTSFFTASDEDFSSPVTLTTGQTVGSANVTYPVSKFLRAQTLSVSIDTVGTSLSNIDGEPVSFTTSSGIVTIVTPEPVSLGLLLCSGFPQIFRQRKLKR